VLVINFGAVNIDSERIVGVEGGTALRQWSTPSQFVTSVRKTR
jgi:hypothetical protein